MKEIKKIFLILKYFYDEEKVWAFVAIICIGLIIILYNYK